MDSLESERELFLIICMLLMVTAPVASWLVVPNRAERGSRLWFAGAALLGIVSVLYFWTRSSTTLLIVANLGAALLAIEALRTELDRPPTPWRSVLLALGLIAAGHEALLVAYTAQRLNEVWVLAPRVFLLVAAEWWIVVLALQVARRHRSRGLVLTAAGTALLALMNSGRLVLVLSGSPGMGPEIGSRAFPVLAAVLTFTALTYSFGFVAFALEKSWARNARTLEELARTQERAAAQTRHAGELQGLIAERDEMLMQSTRLMTLRTMGLYNAAVVHEVSQPLQALRALLDGMRLDPEQPPAQADLQQAAELAARSAELVQSLRRLLSHQQSNTVPTPLNACLAPVVSVIEGEARRLEVGFEWQPDARLDDRPVLIEPLLMQRLLLNLVGNSLDAVSRSATANRHIRLVTHLRDQGSQHWAEMRVQDNGPGFADGVIESRTASVVSSKAQGMGLGLNLSRLLVSSWKGQFELGRADPETGTGALVTVRLPLS